MTERETGLRFEIDERLSIPEEIDTIERLDEIELTPRIETIKRGDHTILTGYLALSGSYASRHDASQSMRFQHQIPVDITMPTERIDKRKQIEIEIEQFDFDVVSKGKLHVTGVLLLRGLQPAETYPRATAQETKFSDNEEILFVHEASQQKEEQTREAKTEQLETINTVQEEIGKRSEHLDDEKVGELHPPDWTEGGWEPEPPPIPYESVPDPQENEPQHFGDHESDQDADSEDEDDYDWLDEEQYRERKEREGLPDIATVRQQGMKIAFIGKHSADADKIQESGSANNLQSENSKAMAHDAASEPLDEEAADQRKETGVEWKKLFLSKEEDTPQFKKVRMCIVQKDETLQSIAERYDLNPREIVLYNRIAEGQEIVAGQVLFIPQ